MDHFYSKTHFIGIQWVSGMAIEGASESADRSAYWEIVWRIVINLSEKQQTKFKSKTKPNGE